MKGPQVPPVGLTGQVDLLNGMNSSENELTTNSGSDSPAVPLAVGQEATLRIGGTVRIFPEKRPRR